MLATAIAASGPLSGQHLIMLYDITETVRAEERVQGMRMMMERTEHLAHIASWEWDVDANRVTWSPEMFRIFGREPEDITLTLQGQSALYPPPDVQKLMDAVQRALHEGQPYELLLDIVLPDGSLRPCYIRGFPERNAAGRVVRLAGLLQDITERKHEEERNRLAVSVFANAREGIVITDAQATIVDANASYSRITGYAREELLGSIRACSKAGASHRISTSNCGRNCGLKAFGKVSCGIGARMVRTLRSTSPSAPCTTRRAKHRITLALRPM